MKKHILISFLIICLLLGSLLLASCVAPNVEPEEEKSIKITWLDADGTLLKEENVARYGDAEALDLPQDTDAWKYIEWKKEFAGKDLVYTAKREPKSTYFVGNVFHIDAKGLGDVTVTYGTGFVFNKDGWFITNSHVMEYAYGATAVFDIKDVKTGEKHTSLEILEAVYNDPDRDIFVGKIDGYSKIASHYRDFFYSSKSEKGEDVFSVSYPKTENNIMVEEGTIIDDLSSMESLFHSSNAYVGYTSYMERGSSGGILVNDRLEVLGMPSIGAFDKEGNYVLGGAIAANSYLDQIMGQIKKTPEDMAFVLHPGYEPYILLFRDLMIDENFVRQEKDGRVLYGFKWGGEKQSDGGLKVVYSEAITFQSNMFIYYEGTFEWEDGQKNAITLYGYYSPTAEIDNLAFSMKYSWKDGSYYIVASDDVNYSPNIDQTLEDYYVEVKFGYTLPPENVTYAKQVFNSVYVWLDEWIAEYK